MASWIRSLFLTAAKGHCITSMANLIELGGMFRVVLANVTS